MSSSYIDPVLIEQHYSTRTFRGYIESLLMAVGLEKTKALLERTGLPWDFINGPNNWVSETFADRFYQILSDEGFFTQDFSYQAGKLSMSSSRFDPVQAVGLQLLEPYLIFKQVESFARKYNKIDSLQIEFLTSNKITLRFRSRRITPHFEQIVLGWAGTLEAVTQLLDIPAEPCKISARDAQSVTFELSWQSHLKYSFFKRAQLVSALGLLSGLSLMGLKLFSSWPNFVSLEAAAGLALTSSTFFSFFAWMTQKIRMKILNKTSEAIPVLVNDHEEQYVELVASKKRLDRRYKEANLLSGVIQRISSSSDAEKLIHTTLSEIHESLKYDRVLYLRLNSEKNTLEFFSAQGFDPEQYRFIENYQINLDVVTSKQFHLGNVFRDRKSILVPVTGDYLEALSSEGKTLIQAMQSKSFLMCSVFTATQGHGVLLVDYKNTQRVLDQDDLHFINNIAKQLAICLDGAKVLATERKLRTTFQKYVPPPVIQSMMGESNQAIQNGVRRNISVIFSDIRGFTSMTSRNDGDTVVKVLNYYFEKMNEIVYEHGGIVDKFMGDAVLAVFNAFGDLEDHVNRAVEVACQMQKSIPAINDYVSKNFLKSGSSFQFSIGIGIHTGEAIVGNIGSSIKMEYTIIGETVNMAQRIENESKAYANSILTSLEVVRLMDPHFKTKSVGYKQLKGIDHAQELHLIEWENLETASGFLEAHSYLNEKKIA